VLTRSVENHSSEDVGAILDGNYNLFSIVDIFFRRGFFQLPPISVDLR